MTLSLPHPVNPGPLQDNFDRIAQQFPIATQNLAKVPQVRAYRSTSQAITTATETTVVFDLTEYDPAGLYNPATGVITFLVPGLYHVFGSAFWTTSALGTARYAYIRSNGTTDISRSEHNPGVVSHVVGTDERFAAGATIELRVFQDTGGNLNVNPSGVQLHLGATWLSN